MINEFKYGQTGKIWPSLLNLSPYSTFNPYMDEIFLQNLRGPILCIMRVKDFDIKKLL